MDFFLSKYLDQDDSQKIVSEDFLSSLIDYDWPGNVRELENSIKKVVLMNPDLYLDRQSIENHLPKIARRIESEENKVNYSKFIESRGFSIKIAKNIKIVAKAKLRDSGGLHSASFPGH